MSARESPQPRREPDPPRTSPRTGSRRRPLAQPSRAEPGAVGGGRRARLPPARTSSPATCSVRGPLGERAGRPRVPAKTCARFAPPTRAFGSLTPGQADPGRGLSLPQRRFLDRDAAGVVRPVTDVDTVRADDLLDVLAGALHRD